MKACSGANGVLVTQSRGYVLRVNAGELDRERFERLASRRWLAGSATALEELDRIAV